MSAAESGAERSPNRLAASSSPYLLLHAHNPVDWYPWGEEAIARARAEDKPIFLSVGYSTCYWCHVMERESFTDAGIAALMNQRFVNVKVDREERPDLDEVYMTATQLLTGQGGWPNSLFLTPALEPFFAGTYFPPEDRWGRPGFRSLLESLAAAWDGRRAEVEEQARELGEAIRHHLEHALAPAPRTPGPELAAASLRSLARRFDATWGGFGEAPKFPTPSSLMVLLEFQADAAARSMLATTLDRMARGGIFDQLGGGFHRYATDREWRVPHFEKMLYDNGSLLEIYARAWAVLGDPELRRVARETIAFLERELSAPEGGFWSAVDAETHGHEGAYYVWTRSELDAALGEEDAAFLAPLLGFDGAPFFEGAHYVLHLPRPLAELAERRRSGYDALLGAMVPLRARLLSARAARERPATDDKVLADWNGLAIAGLAVAGRLFGEPSAVARAERAADFVLAAMRSQGVLLHSWRQQPGEVLAFLADYAFLGHGLLELYEATGKQSWLAAAVELAREQRRRLAHPDGGFYTAAASDDLLSRSREVFDGASPASNGMALLNLVRLAELTGDRSFREEAERALRALGSLAESQPAAARTLALAALRFHAAPRAEDAAPAASPPARARTPRAGAMLQAEGAGVVSAALRLEAEDADGWRRFRLRLSIAAGWHLQADSPSAPGAAMRVEGVGCEVRLDSAPGPVEQLDGSPALPIWEGTLDLLGRLRGTSTAPRLRLIYRPCDATRCLPPISVDIDALSAPGS